MGKKYFVNIFLTVIFVLLCYSSYSQTGMLRGTVTDSTGAPLEDAYVYVSRYNQKDIILVTDGHGRFLHKGLPAGIYDLVVVGQGHAIKEVRGVVVFEEGIINQHVNLDKAWRRVDYDDGYGRLPGDCD